MGRCSFPGLWSAARLARGDAKHRCFGLEGLRPRWGAKTRAVVGKDGPGGGSKYWQTWAWSVVSLRPATCVAPSVRCCLRICTHGSARVVLAEVHSAPCRARPSRFAQQRFPQLPPVLASTKPPARLWTRAAGSCVRPLTTESTFLRCVAHQDSKPCAADSDFACTTAKCRLPPTKTRHTMSARYHLTDHHACVSSACSYSTFFPRSTQKRGHPTDPLRKKGFKALSLVV
mmetsp:Transcript_5826/g.10120  ORF Transcript_5826/g.10120 Transcript_5826/m.10120 type:complete len:230 (+) Transcript_5826:502-1191(+)